MMAKYVASNLHRLLSSTDVSVALYLMKAYVRILLVAVVFWREYWNVYVHNHTQQVIVGGRYDQLSNENSISDGPVSPFQHK